MGAALRAEVWPRQMTAETLVAYLDMGTTQTLYRHIKAAKDFPAKDPRTGRWDREAIDKWLASKEPEAGQEADDWRREFNEWAGSK